MLGFDSTNPIDCQVRIISPLLPTLALTGNASAKLWVVFELVSHLYMTRNDGRGPDSSISIDIRLLGLRGRVNSDRASHVRLFSRRLPSSAKRPLIYDDGYVRIAIWDMNRIAVAIAMGAWLTNVAFLIHGKSTPSPLHFLERSENLCARSFL